jgi:hypothetical protein
MSYQSHFCGLYYLHSVQVYQAPERKYLPQVSLSAHTTILSTTSRTTLTQNFVNPDGEKPIPELRYSFPLYDGVSVVGFTCTINKDRVIRGLVKERAEARKTFDAAVQRGETAGLLEQLPDASDVFTTTIGNVPAGAQIEVEIVYLGELKHDAEVDGIRFTIPTSIAPRYGSFPDNLLKDSKFDTKKGISIVVDAEMPAGCNIKSVQSPSHPISVSLGNTSAGTAAGAEMSLQKASATLSLSTAELDKDFILQVVATGTGNPTAVLETHPTIPNHRAIMATLVPKFNLPAARPEIVFVCDRSGSMETGTRIPDMISALQIFLKSLPVGVKFNICSFGSHFQLLFPKGSKSYDESSLKEATKYVSTMSADFGGTEMYRPLEHVLTNRYKDMPLEVFVLTDGEVWNQEELFGMINKHVDASKGAIRVFTLGIGNDVSHALIEGVARAGNGFAQTVAENEQMNSKVVRMLKAALSPHISDYTMEVKYAAEEKTDSSSDDFEIVEKVMDAMTIEVSESEKPSAPAKKPIALFDEKVDPDIDMPDVNADNSAGGKYAGVPAVAEPKMLQAPFIIPPLYSFSRTTVYMLLSPEATQRTPTSVVLRATSEHGPLELEIPIASTLGGSVGETIHQLAARKAIRELEDGRGWLYNAREAGANASLLKDKYPGRFSDMVEREAVRLGVKFQVGGKWCSFVAVEENSDQTVDVKETVQVAPPVTTDDEGGAAPARKLSKSLGGFARLRRAAPAAAPALAAAPAPAPAMQMLASSAVPPPPPPPYGGPGYGSAPKAAQSRSSSAILAREELLADVSAELSSQRSTIQHCSDSLVEKKGSGPGMLSWLSNRGSRKSEKSKKTHSPAPGAVQSLACEPMALEIDTSDAGFAMPCDDDADEERLAKEDNFSMAETSIADGRGGAGLSSSGLDAIVGSQAFSGAWSWDDKLFTSMGVQVSRLKQLVSEKESALGGKDNSALSNRLATAVVLAYLETKLAGRRDEWEMIAEKAKAWLEAELSSTAGITVDSYLKEVRDIMNGSLSA